jgi:hypothetical protein
MAATALGAALWIGGCAAPSRPDAAPSGDRTAAASVDAGNARRVARPPFYAVEGGPGATLLVLGTIHVGPPGGWIFSPAVEAAIGEADEIALEVDLRLVSQDEITRSLAEFAVLRDGTTLPELLAPETQQLLSASDAEVTRLGLSRELRAGMKPWFLGLAIGMAIIRETGFSGELGVEQQLMKSIGARKVVELERFDEQMQILDGLSPLHEDLVLRDALSRLDDARAELLALVEAWRTGDEAALAGFARQGVDEFPELDGAYDILLGERNRRWIRKLKPILDARERSGERVLVAVGALHLVGREGLVELLRGAGYRATAISQSGARASDGR